MYRCRNILLIFLLLAIFSCVAAQSLQGLSENPVLKKYLNDHSFLLKAKADESTLFLPFFEDFSSLSVIPDPEKWIDRSAFINSSFAVDPVSIGVATLDAIDENGNIYAMTDFPTSSDELTTHPFDLSAYASSGDSVRLSFFYQAGGKGEVPESSDSLILEYYSPAADQWGKAWYAIADSTTEFRQVLLTVPVIYYQNGFRFRFRNYTSISANEIKGGKGALSNVDCWNIDYIMMNTRPRNDHLSINDVTLVDPPRELIDFYEIIPWSHLNDAQSITRNIMHYVIRNLEMGDSVNIGRSYYIKNLGSGTTEFYEQYFAQFGPYSIARRNDPFYAPFTRTNDSDEGNIEVGAFLITDADQYKQNDTAKTILNFRDYYAYDDGTPEYGFGISGESTEGALLAYRFRIYRTDTLRALDMYFNKTRDDFNADLKFHLCIWKDNDGLPGELIYMSPEVFSPGTELGMPVFKRYPIMADQELVITDTVFYAGWKQVTDEFLNLGFDVNRNNIDRIFVNISGDWFNPGSSIIPGSLMIRAVFGDKNIITRNDEIPSATEQVILFPNPATEKINIRLNGITIRQLAIYDAYGKPIIYEENYQDVLDVSSFPAGVYMIQLTSDKGKIIIRKILVTH
jgi:hypothetical protein